MTWKPFPFAWLRKRWQIVSDWLRLINQGQFFLVALCNYKNPGGKCWNNCSSSDNTKAGIFPPNPADSFFTENIEDWTCRGKYLK